MKLNAFIFLVLIYNSLFAQNEPEIVQNKISRLQIGLNYSGSYCYRFLMNGDGSEMSDWIIRSRNDIEVPIFGYSIGLNVRFSINNRLGFQSGLKYTRKGERTIKSVPNVADPSDPAVPDYGNFIYHYYFLDIPLLLNYTVELKKIKFITSFGLVNNIGIKQINTSIAYYPDYKYVTKYETDLRYSRNILSAYISTGFMYNMNNKLALRVEPYFTVNTVHISNTPIRGYLYSGGLDVSIWFNL